ncbi:MAG: UDP-N-acetylmuramate dehydrogenase [Ruminococcus sp.]
MEKFFGFLNDNHIEYICDEPMKNHTTFKVGGNAQVFVTVNSKEKLSALMKYINAESLDYFILGKGSNLLVSDSGIKGVVISLSGEFTDIKTKDGNKIFVGAGASLMKLCRFAQENSLSGLEFAYGIPGSVGGAVFMNAGAYGGEMKDCLVSADYITPQGECGTFKKDELQLGYRTSVFKNKNYIITGCTLSLKEENKDIIKEKMDDLLGRRKSKQPLEYPSAGSTFKRPEGAFAGTLIESCGLKGYTIGGACVSEKHAGFIINKGDATFEDIDSLIKEVQKKVKEETGYFLETEVIRI